MGQIILYTCCVRKRVRARKDTMYGELVNNLQNEPAKMYTINDAEKLADRVLEIGGYDNFGGPTPIVEIARQFGFTTFQEKNMPEDISGNIFVGGTTRTVYNTDKVIVVGGNEEYYHQRFIIAHELAHYLLDYLGSETSLNARILFSKAYLKNNHNSSEEIRADRFAAQLLMPAKIFYRQYIKAMQVSNYSMRYVIVYLSDYFETKRSSIERRIQEVIF